jgi:ParB/RepB/Spo0J family partition protein
MKQQELMLLNVRDIVPNSLIAQKRDRALLATSIRKHSILQNIAVRPHPKRRGRFEIIFGLGRWEQAKQIGRKQIWALVRECSDIELLKLAGQENFARSNPSPVQEGELLKKLRDLGCSTRELADEYGISVGQVVERIKLVEALPLKAKRAIDSGKVATSTFEFVRSSIRDATTQAQVFETVIQKDLDLDSTVQLVRGMKATSELYEKAEAFRSPNATKPRTEDLTFTIEAKQSQVIRGSNGSLLVRDSENHRDRDLPEELRKAWLKLQPGDFVEFSFRHTTSVHIVNSSHEHSSLENAKGDEKN